MGEHEVRSLPHDIVLNGLLGDEAGNVTRVLDRERWLEAEERTAGLLACIQPSLPSEERRNAIVDYVQRLIMKCFSCEVFTYGSVPLKTYLPDGDIDLTVFSKNEDLKDTWHIEVLKVLENEEKSENAEFRVKEIQHIQAEVKIIKCLVENIVVDISFNQVGGLCTLCFLEQIDQLISRNHLFKRSIILIKAWCYYESRTLGAHHGLISTYALEILVLYIFHVFNNSFTGPLEVLYRFLAFFSRFDWDNFCVSLLGPIPISSLPDLTAESPRKDGGEFLLSGLFLEECRAIYAVLPGGQESQGQQFFSKHFNVIDPLRTNNNLGRSVSKGNFYRIRTAFAFGAKRLARVIDCPKEDLIAEVNQFFMNTWQRRRSANRPDAPAPTIRYLQSVKDGPDEESSHSRGSANLIKSTECFSNAYSASKSSMDSHSSSQKFYANRIGSSDFDRMERANYSNQQEQGSSSFARTQSSSALAETPADDHSRTRHGKVVETGGSRRKNSNLDVSNIQTARVSFDAAPQSNRVSKSYQDDISFTTLDEAASAYEALELQRLEQQDMVNKIASSLAHNFIGQVQVPMHFALPPFLASMGYGQKNLVTLIDPSTMQFPQGFISSQPPQHISNFEELTVIEGSCMTSLNQESRNIGSTRGLITDTGEFQTLQFDERQHSSSGHFNYAHSSRASNSGAENEEFQQQISGASGIIIADRNVNTKQTKSTRNNCGKTPSTSEVENFTIEKEPSEWEFEATSEAASSQEDDESGDWISTTASTANMSEHAAPLVPSHSRSGYYEQAHIRGTNSMIPFSFYPTGPTVPFLTMVPVYNIPTDRAIFDDSINQVEDDNGTRHFHASPSGENFNHAENHDQLDRLMNLSISDGATRSSSEEHIPDILNSDFASHWQNLQHGRFCQNTIGHGPFIYSSPYLVPPAYLHGHFPMDCPGRPVSANTNFTQMTGYAPRLVPVASLPPGSSRPSYGVYNRYEDESQRYQGGTGTYIPSPTYFRERQFSNARIPRGDHKHDRRDQTR